MKVITGRFLYLIVTSFAFHMFFVGKADAATRVSYVSIPLSTYHYLTVTNIFSVSQTVTLSFKSTGVNLKAGGFQTDINGWNSPGGAVASSGVSCSTNTCSLTASLAKAQSIRLRARVDKGVVPDYKLSAPSTSNASAVGLVAEVSVLEDVGRVVASAFAWTDIDVTPAMFVDSATIYTINGGKPF